MDVVVTDRCQGCGACLLTCPEHAFRPRPRRPPGAAARPAHSADLLGNPFPGGPDDGPLLVVQELCTGCLECVEVCPADAIEARVPAGEEGA